MEYDVMKVNKGIFFKGVPRQWYTYGSYEFYSE